MRAGDKITLVRDIVVGAFVYGLEEFDPPAGSSGGVRYIAGTMAGEVVRTNGPVKGRITVSLSMVGERLPGRQVHVRPESIGPQPTCGKCGAKLLWAGLCGWCASPDRTGA